jgi:predicted SprT family Zn-dependent metalloprotease
MNQDKVKERLVKLHDCIEDFTLIFSGKKSKKVNGLYRLDKHEIIIHNLNFENNESGENLLFYTAMHELAHHIQYTELKQKSAKAHTQLFYALLDDLVDTAEKKELYKVEIDKETQDYIDEIRDISCRIAKLQRDLGEAVERLQKKCEETGLRFDDIIERKAQISMKTVKKSIKAGSLYLPEEIGADIQEAVIRERDEGKKAAIIHAAQEGKSVAQAKRAVVRPIDREDETVSLVKEKKRIERTITSLNRRLEELEEQLRSRGEL